MTDFSDCIGYVDQVKLEFHERFKHLLEANAQLEERVISLEENKRLPKRWFTEPYASYQKKKQELQQTRGRS